MSAPSAPTTPPAPHKPFRWHERLLPALVFHVVFVVSLVVGFALQQLVGPIVLLALVQFAAGVGTLVALVRWMNLRLLAAGHPHPRIEVFIGPLLLVGVVVSLLGWPLLNELRELPLLHRGSMTVSEAATALRPGPVVLDGISVSQSEAVQAPFKVRVRTGTWPTVDSWFAPLRDARGEVVGWACAREKTLLATGAPTGQPWLVTPGEQTFSDARMSPHARSLRAPEWKDRCVLFPPPGSSDAPTLPWFTLAVLGLSELALLFTALRNAR